MDYDNTLLDDEKLTYYAWHKSNGQSNSDLELDGSRAGGVLNMAVAELTVGRLVLENNPILTITNEEGEEVLSIPLIDTALLYKRVRHQNMDNQEFLDRQDEYDIALFLDEDDRWINSYIYINSWKVVLNNEDLF